MLSCKEYAALKKEQIKKMVENSTQKPVLSIIQIGDNPASNSYVKGKIRDCEEVGIIADVYQYPEDITEHELCEAVRLDQEHYDGVIVQLPLPPHISQEAVVAAINKDKDVDGFRHDSLFDPATPKGIMDYLKY